VSDEWCAVLLCRWDMQRLREQKANERLYQSRTYRDMNGAQDDDDEFDSFLPDPDKGKPQMLHILEEFWITLPNAWAIQVLWMVVPQIT
jgi:hypothetical protein